MRNPNNKKCPNLWTTDRAGIAKFKRECETRGIAKYLRDPYRHIGFGLTHAEAIFLIRCNDRIALAEQEQKQKAI